MFDTYLVAKAMAISLFCRPFWIVSFLFHYKMPTWILLYIDITKQTKKKTISAENVLHSLAAGLLRCDSHT